MENYHKNRKITNKKPLILRDFSVLTGDPYEIITFLKIVPF